MIDLPVNYAKVLLEIDMEPEQVEIFRSLLMDSIELKEALISPVVRKTEKRNIIERLFPQPVWSFVKVMSDNGDIGCAGQMFEEYDKLLLNRQNTVKAVLTYVTKPEDAQIEGLKKKIARDHGKERVELELVKDESLIGGFVLTVGDSVIDQSVKTSMEKLKRHLKT